jgi:hypothetical protein
LRALEEAELNPEPQGDGEGEQEDHVENALKHRAWGPLRKERRGEKGDMQPFAAERSKGPDAQADDEQMHGLHHWTAFHRVGGAPGDIGRNPGGAKIDNDGGEQGDEPELPIGLASNAAMEAEKSVTPAERHQQQRDNLQRKNDEDAERGPEDALDRRFRDSSPVGLRSLGTANSLAGTGPKRFSPSLPRRKASAISQIVGTRQRSAPAARR